jgi:hypothetical protein
VRLPSLHGRPVVDDRPALDDGLIPARSSIAGQPEKITKMTSKVHVRVDLLSPSRHLGPVAFERRAELSHHANKVVESLAQIRDSHHLRQPPFEIATI